MNVLAVNENKHRVTKEKEPVKAIAVIALGLAD
jgi:hypothetical protein